MKFFSFFGGNRRGDDGQLAEIHSAHFPAHSATGLTTGIAPGSILLGRHRISPGNVMPTGNIRGTFSCLQAEALWGRLDFLRRQGAVCSS